MLAQNDTSKKKRLLQTGKKKHFPVQSKAVDYVPEWLQTHPRPSARMCEMSKEGMKTLRNSAEKMPPFFMTPLFLILRDTERRGCLKWNSLIGTISQKTIKDNILNHCEWLILFIRVVLLWWNVFGSAGPVSDPVSLFAEQDVFISLLPLWAIFVWLQRSR